jgi:hypothetical protein
MASGVASPAMYVPGISSEMARYLLLINPCQGGMAWFLLVLSFFGNSPGGEVVVIGNFVHKKNTGGGSAIPLFLLDL